MSAWVGFIENSLDELGGINNFRHLASELITSLDNTMKQFSKILKRKKPSTPPQQPNTVGKPAAVSAGPPGFWAEQDVVPDGAQIVSCRGINVDFPDMTVLLDDGSEIVPQTPFQSGTEDTDQEPLVSVARASGVATGKADGGNHPTSECP